MRNRRINHDTQALIFGLAVTGLFMALVFGGVYVAKSWECDNYRIATGRETKMVGVTCYVKHGGEWWTLKQLGNRTAGSDK
jgi:hypothetical protein